MDANSQDLSLSEASPRLPDRQECFLCHGVGHWARHCTSLPSVYLADNPPKCYCCGGTGHFARFCPSNEATRDRFAKRRRVLSNPEDWIRLPWVESPFLHYYDPSSIPLFTGEPVMPPTVTSHPSNLPTPDVSPNPADQGTCWDNHHHHHHHHHHPMSDPTPL